MTDDTTAIRRSRGGDRDAFRHLVERYEREAIGHALALLGDREEARDAVQEAFLDAYRALGRFDVGRPFYPWLYVLLRHRCFKRLRSRRNEPVARSPAGTILAPADGEAREAREALETALARLSPEDRELLTLRHLDGLSGRELAERLAIPEGTVMSRLHHARKRLRRELVSLGALEDRDV